MSEVPLYHTMTKTGERGEAQIRRESSVDERDFSACTALHSAVQGYLAHEKHPHSLGPPYGPRHSPTVERKQYVYCWRPGRERIKCF